MSPDDVKGDVADHVGDGASRNRPLGLLTRGIRRPTGIPGRNKSASGNAPWRGMLLSVS